MGTGDQWRDVAVKATNAVVFPDAAVLYGYTLFMGLVPAAGDEFIFVCVWGYCISHGLFAFPQDSEEFESEEILRKQEKF